MAPLARLRDAHHLSGAARGIAFQLVEGLGILPRVPLETLIHGLTATDRRRLGSLGVRIGAIHVFVQPLLKPRSRRMTALLWSVAHRLIRPPDVPPDSAMSLTRAEGVPPAFYEALGFLPVGDRAIRVDRLQALADAAAELARQGPFQAPPTLASLVGGGRDALPSLLTLLGYRQVVEEDGTRTFHPRPTAKRRRRPADRAGSPFAKLKALANDR